MVSIKAFSEGFNEWTKFGRNAALTRPPGGVPRDAVYLGTLSKTEHLSRTACFFTNNRGICYSVLHTTYHRERSLGAPLSDELRSLQYQNNKRISIEAVFALPCLANTIMFEAFLAQFRIYVHVYMGQSYNV